MPEFPPGQPTTDVEQWYVEEIIIGNEDIMVVDYLVRGGVVTSERRERFLTEQEVQVLYQQGRKRTFSDMMGDVSGLAE